MKYSFRKYTLKPRFLCKIPLFFQNFKSNILIRRSNFKFNDTIIRIICILQVILRGFLFVVQIWIKYIEFITLNCFRRRIFLTKMQSIVFIPLTSNSDSVNVKRLCLSKSSLGFTWNPIIKILLILLHSFIFFKLNNLFGYLIISICLFSY